MAQAIRLELYSSKKIYCSRRMIEGQNNKYYSLGRYIISAFIIVKYDVIFIFFVWQDRLHQSIINHNVQFTSL